MPSDSVSCGGIFDVDLKREKLTELENRMAEPGFWSDQQSAQAVVQQVKTLKGWIDPFEKIEGRLGSAQDLESLLASDPDEEMSRELDAEIAAVSEDLEALRLRSLLSGP